MTQARTPAMTGGCQCGAVRYALYAEPEGPHICHCRMCQKAFGSYFAPLASVDIADFAWTRGRPGTFSSSSVVERGFCADCGTPLSIRDIDGTRIDIALGSLDRPQDVAPRQQHGAESMVPFFAELHALPATRTEDESPPDRLALLRSRQHPDRDTDHWPTGR